MSPRKIRQAMESQRPFDSLSVFFIWLFARMAVVFYSALYWLA